MFKTLILIHAESIFYKNIKIISLKNICLNLKNKKHEDIIYHIYKYKHHKSYY